MGFDEPVDRWGTLSMKWDKAAERYDVDPDDCLPMWVADSDFRIPDCISDALRAYVDHGVFGYMGDYAPWKKSIRWWMETRHGWRVEPEWIMATGGVVNAVAVALQAYTEPGDGVVLFTPVYHAFGRIIEANGRRVVEVPLKIEDGRHVMDMDAARAAMTGDERMVILCSPHNPGGRVWTEDEIGKVADLAVERDLILVSDEIHQDLVFAPNRHRVTATVTDISDRLVTMTAASKAFNIAALHCAHTIIADDALRARFQTVLAANAISPGSTGVIAATAAMSPAGAEWLDAQVAYLAANRERFDAGVNAIPGVSAMPLEATYLSWVDFSGTGMDQAEIERRVIREAGIAANLGPTFGTGGEGWMRFNIATQAARIDEAVDRLSRAFADLQ